MNILFDNSTKITDIEKAKIKRMIKAQKNELCTLNEKEEFLMQQDVAIIGSKQKNTIVVKRILPLLA